MLYCNLQVFLYWNCCRKTFWSPEMWLLEGPGGSNFFSRLAIAFHILWPPHKSCCNSATETNPFVGRGRLRFPADRRAPCWTLDTSEYSPSCRWSCGSPEFPAHDHNRNKQCVRPPQFAPASHVTLTVDFSTLKVISESRVTWATSVPILVFLGLSVLDLGSMYARRRQTDRRQTRIIA